MKSVPAEMKKKMHRRSSTLIHQKLSQSMEFDLENQLGPKNYRIIEEG